MCPLMARGGAGREGGPHAAHKNLGPASPAQKPAAGWCARFPPATTISRLHLPRRCRSLSDTTSTTSQRGGRSPFCARRGRRDNGLPGRVKASEDQHGQVRRTQALSLERRGTAGRGRCLLTREEGGDKRALTRTTGRAEQLRVVKRRGATPPACTFIRHAAGHDQLVYFVYPEKQAGNSPAIQTTMTELLHSLIH